MYSPYFNACPPCCNLWSRQYITHLLLFGLLWTMVVLCRFSLTIHQNQLQNEKQQYEMLASWKSIWKIEVTILSRCTFDHNTLKLKIYVMIKKKHNDVTCLSKNINAKCFLSDYKIIQMAITHCRQKRLLSKLTHL